MGYLYALYLLAQFRETRAYPLMIELLSTPGNDIDTLLGDALVEDGGRWLASVYDGDIEPLKRLVENTAATGFRGRAGRPLIPRPRVCRFKDAARQRANACGAEV